MFNLLKLEFRKLRKQKSFYICTIIMIILILLSAITNNILSQDEELSFLTDTSTISILISAISNCSFTLIAGIFIALFTCEDYEQQTIKNIYSKGYSHLEVYYSKLISALTATGIMHIIVLLFAFLINVLIPVSSLTNSGINASGLNLSETLNLPIANIIYLVIAQFFAVTAYMCLDYVICSFLKKNGSSIAAIIVYPLIVNIIIGLINSLINSDSFDLGKYWISSLLGTVSAVNNNFKEISFSFAGSLIYIFIFIIIGAILCQPFSGSKQKYNM